MPPDQHQNNNSSNNGSAATSTAILDDAPDSAISYTDAIDYWTGVPATVDGVLGGFGNTSLPRTDVRGSLQFIRSVRRKVPAFDEIGKGTALKRGCDIGAGYAYSPSKLVFFLLCLNLLETIFVILTENYIVELAA